MFGKHHIITQLAGGFAIAAVAAVVAVSSAAAGTSSGDRTRGQACQTTATSWHVVTDDLGIPWLEPVGLEACTDAPLACTSASSTPAPNTGWIVIVDDLGVPSLSQLAPSEPALTPQACVQQAAAPAAQAGSAPVKPKVSVKKKASVKKASSSLVCRFRHSESVTGC
jgi:hypothetical protein